MSSAPRHGGRRSLLVALLACALAASATAQHPSPPGIREDDSGGGSSGQDQKVSTAMVALLAAVVAVFVFIAASTIYLRHCTGYNYNIDAAAPSTAGRSAAGDDAAFSSSLSWWHRRRRRRGSSRGLDAEAIEAFPTMTYAEAKALRVSKQGGGALECAVCLSEFEDGDKLRLLLPRCSHAFHPDCIAEWLAGHVTCPVCRCNLQPSHNNKDTSISNDGEPAPTIPFASSVSSETAAAAWQDGGPLPVAVLIDVVTEEELRQEEMELQCIGTQRRAMRTSRSLGRQPPPTTPAQLAGRWHSMGDLERFTLRLPEHVRREMVAATASEHSSLQLHRGGERVVEGGSGRSEPLIDRPSTWQSLIGRTFSGKVPFFSASRRMMTPTSSGDGEVSSTSSYSYTRLRGRRVAAFVDVAADVAAAEGEGSTCGLDRAGVGGSGYDAKAGAASSEVAAGEEKAVGVDVA